MYIHVIEAANILRNQYEYSLSIQYGLVNSAIIDGIYKNVRYHHYQVYSTQFQRPAKYRSISVRAYSCTGLCQGELPYSIS